MTALDYRKQAAWLDGCAIRLEQRDVARLFRNWAEEARARALLLDARGERGDDWDTDDHLPGGYPARPAPEGF